MRSHRRAGLGVVRITLAAFATLCLASPDVRSRSGGAIALTPDGETVVVANSDSSSVSLVDVAARALLTEIEVGRDPRVVAVDAAGVFAWVSNRDDGTVSRIELAGRRVDGTFPVGHQPFGVVVGSTGRVWIAAEGVDEVRALDSATGSLLAVVPTEDRPRGLALAPDGRLWVTHFLSGRISVLDVDIEEVESTISTGLDTNLSQSVLFDPGAGRAYLPQTRSNVTNEALLFDTTVFPIVSVLDLATSQNLLRERLALDIADEPVNMPIDVALTSSGKLYVLAAGSNDISVVDLATGTGVAHIEVGDNPRGLALSPDEATLWVNNTLGGSVSVVDTSLDVVIDEIVVTDIPLDPAVLAGKILFNSSDRSDLAKDQWISCEVCHPDAEMDGRTWFFTDGPRNTPSLLGVRDTRPVHWSGDLDELHDVESTVRNIQAGTGLVPGPDGCDPACDQGPPNAGRSRDLDDLAAYMEFLVTRPSPFLLDTGELGEGATRGQVLFGDPAVGCAECHPPPLYTDRQRHDVGTASSPKETKGSFFDTPSLRGVHGTAPYLHDGSAGSLLDVPGAKNPEDRHGVTSHLTGAELADLVDFLRSLPRGATSCEEDATTLCLNDDRFRVEASWATVEGDSGAGQASELTEDTGTFWFFAPENIEVVVKVLDGCGVNGRYWVFAAGLTDVEVELIVIDTSTGDIRVYRNPQKSPFDPVQDTAAFSTCP